jgi:hypothetical protein
MPKGGLRSTSFTPGVLGNPDRRPKGPETIEARRAVADVKAAARELTPEAMGTLKRYGGSKGAVACKDCGGDCSSRSRLGQANAGSRGE